MEDRKLVPLAEAAFQARRSYRVMYDAVTRGVVAGERINGRLFVEASSLADYVRRQQTHAPTAPRAA